MEFTVIVILLLTGPGQYMTWQNIVTLISVTVGLLSVVGAGIAIIKAHSLWKDDRPMLKADNKRISDAENDIKILITKSSEMDKSIRDHIEDNNSHFNKLYDLNRKTSDQMIEMMQNLSYAVMNKKINLRGEREDEQNRKRD